MAINPFDMLKQFQNIQSRMGEIQEKLRLIRVVGSAGGGLVTIEMNGQMEVEKVTIAPEAVDPKDIRMLEDLMLAALTDTLTRLKEKMREEMSQFTGLNLPPGLLGFAP
jgi:DNA-binding YbaB/EbfC family protein